MAEVKAAPAPFAKARSSLLSLDEVPHKRHVPPPVFSTYNPLVPEPGTPAFATRQDQFAVDTAAQLKRTDEARRQQKMVDLSFVLHSGVSCRVRETQLCTVSVQSCRRLSMIAGSIIVQLNTRVSARKTGSLSVKEKGH